MAEKVTLVDKENAQKDFEFLHMGMAEECLACILRKACVENLEKGRKYRIVQVMDKEHQCPISGPTMVVKVMESEILSAIEKKKAITGAKIKYAPVDCENIFCEDYKFCRPEGLKEGDEVQVTEVIRSLNCSDGKEFSLVKLKRVSKP